MTLDFDHWLGQLDKVPIIRVTTVEPLEIISLDIFTEPGEIHKLLDDILSSVVGQRSRQNTETLQLL